MSHSVPQQDSSAYMLPEFARREPQKFAMWSLTSDEGARALAGKTKPAPVPPRPIDDAHIVIELERRTPATAGTTSPSPTPSSIEHYDRTILCSTDDPFDLNDLPHHRLVPVLKPEPKTATADEQTQKVARSRERPVSANGVTERKTETSTSSSFTVPAEPGRAQHAVLGRTPGKIARSILARFSPHESSSDVATDPRTWHRATKTTNGEHGPGSADARNARRTEIAKRLARMREIGAVRQALADPARLPATAQQAIERKLFDYALTYRAAKHVGVNRGAGPEANEMNVLRFVRDAVDGKVGRAHATFGYLAPKLNAFRPEADRLIARGPTVAADRIAAKLTLLEGQLAQTTPILGKYLATRSHPELRSAARAEQQLAELSHHWGKEFTRTYDRLRAEDAHLAALGAKAAPVRLAPGTQTIERVLGSRTQPSG